MIIQSMLFLFTVSLFATAAALAADAGLRRLRLPSRWVWLGSLALGPAMLASAWMPRSGGAAATAGPGLLPVFEIPGLTVGGAVGGSLPWAWLGGAVWALSAAALLALLIRTRATLERERAGWEGAHVLERSVLLSANRGPAVAGVVRPWIVLPRWVLGLPAAHLRMVLLHEEEHLRARDTVLLAGALALVALAAWNPITWWQLRRLRTAVEVDCDRRVLAREPDPRTYGESLLTVAARVVGPSLGLAAFTERTPSLKHRILTMTSRTSRWAGVRGTLLVALAAVLAIQACGVDEPTTLYTAGGNDAVSPLAPQVVQPASLGDEPVFTPFTVAPSILNRDEVIEAMVSEYPPLLRDAGIGGTVRVYFFIRADGSVGDVRVDQSSGHEALDQAAVRVGNVYRFSPALNRDEKVPVWVSFPITFQVR